MPAITTTVTAAAVASLASLLSLLFPYISPQPLGSFFCFIFLFCLLTASFSFIHICSCSHLCHASPSSPPLPFVMRCLRPHPVVPHPCHIAPRMCRLCRIVPLSCVASIVSPFACRIAMLQHLFGLATSCLLRAPLPHAPFLPHIHTDLRVLSHVSHCFCNTSCGTLFMPPDNSRKRKMGRSSPPKPNS